MSSPTKLEQIPPEVREYLTAGDGLGQAAVHDQYPNLDRTLHAATTRAAIVQYLGSKEPFQDQPSLTINALALLQNGASAKEAAILRPLAKHPNPWVRLRLYEYLMAVYYPPRDQASMTKLFQEMLDDPDEVVRVQAARWINSLHLAEPMQPVLQHWMTLAPQRKWDHGESYEILQSLTK